MKKTKKSKKKRINREKEPEWMETLRKVLKDCEVVKVEKTN